MEEPRFENASLVWTENMAAINFDQNTLFNSSYNQDIVLVWYYINGLGGTLISVLGVAGNVTAALVLMMPVMRNSTSILLVAMAVFDSIFLVLHCLVQSLTLILFYNDVGDGYIVVREFLFKYCNALVHIAHTGTIYMAVLVTLERAMAVLLPLKAKHICTKGRAWLASLAVVAWSVLYNVPKYLEFEADDQFPVTLFSVRKSDFGNGYFFNHIYVVYFNGAIHFVIPVGLITVLNLKMIQTVCSRGKRMARQSSVRSHMQSKLTIMIVILTAIFCMCQLLAAIPLVLFPDENVGQAGGGEDAECHVTCAVVRAVGETGTLLNSATNFIVYSIFGHKFRRCLGQMCCYCCRMVRRERFFNSSSRGSPPCFSSTMTRLQHMDGSFRTPMRNSYRKVGSIHRYRTTENGSDETRLSNTSEQSNV